MTGNSTETLPPSSRLLVTVTGRDSPNAASSIITAAASSKGTLLDIRHTVVHTHLTLILALALPPPPDAALIYPALIEQARNLNLNVNFDLLPDTVSNSGKNYYVVTLLAADELAPAFLAKVADCIAKRGFSTERIGKLSRDGVKVLEVGVSLGGEIGGNEVVQIRKELFELGAGLGVDVAFQRESLMRRSRRLVVFDMDSTLIQQEVIDELAKHAGKYEEVKAITKRAMGGGMDFAESLRQRVALLKGTKVSAFDHVIENLIYTPGAKELCSVLKKLGYRLAVISGGFTRVTKHVRNELGLDYDYANTLEERDGVFTGRTVGMVVTAQKKADLLMSIAQQEKIDLEQTIAIGDGANDLPMLGTAGLGVAFNAKPAVQEKASFRINQPSLMSVLYLMGMSDGDQQELSGRGMKRFEHLANQ